MHGENPTLPKSEWAVMEVIWANPGATGANVYEQLGALNGWKQKTINSFLRRLIDRGFLKAERVSRAFRYWPLVQRERCLRAEGESLIERMFKGKWAPMLVHFVEEADLSQDELDSLETLIKQKKEETGR